MPLRSFRVFGALLHHLTDTLTYWVAMHTFHIRAPLPRIGSSNRFFAVDAPRVQKTLCGQPITLHDIKFRWQALAVGDHVPCAECCRIKNDS